MYKYLICVFIFFLGNAKMYAQRVACIGASNTYGATMPEREKYAYPAQLGALLGVGYEVFNYGVSGCTMLKKGNLSYWNTKEYLQALSCSPDVVFIDLGGNDSKLINRKYLNEFEADCRAMIRSFRKSAFESTSYIVDAYCFVRDRYNRDMGYSYCKGYCSYD